MRICLETGKKIKKIGTQAYGAGRFSLSVPVFRSGGGKQESERLEVPLLASIPLVPGLVVASDSGEPYVLAHPDAPAGRAFTALADAVMKQVPA